MLFIETDLNIIRNFIPHETVIIDNRVPPWIITRIKKAINDRNLAFKCFVKSKGSVDNNGNLERFNYLQKNWSSLIETLKQEHFSKITKTEAATRRVLLKRCSKKFRKIHRKTPVPESNL